MSVPSEATPVGVAAQSVFVTSVSDDTVGGDSNRDGSATTPQPDQWGGLSFEAGSTVMLATGSVSSSTIVPVALPAAALTV